MKNFSIEVKIILSVVLFTMVILAVERYKMTSIISEQFMHSEQSRNELLINTVSPIITLNLSLGLNSTNKEYLDEILLQNADILHLKITDSNNAVLYEKNASNFVKDSNQYYLFNRALVDNLTDESIGNIELFISNERYENVIHKNSATTYEILLITLILLILFIYILKLEFKPLKELSNTVKQYNPKRNNFPAKKSLKKDEVGIIQNSIIDMVAKINHHTKLLDESNNSLEEKIKLRTHSLHMANVELEGYKNNLEKKVSQAIEEKEKANILLAQQSKMASLGEMLASISHQWKQPLSVISNCNIQLKLDNELEVITYDTVQESTQEIENQITFMTQTLRDFSDFFKPDKAMISFSPMDAIKSIINLFGKEYKAQKIAFNIEDKDSAGKIIIVNYLNEFKQVILNLLSNAKDAIIEQKASNTSIDILIQSKESYIEISVQDYAGGINPEVIDTIFDPYVTTKSADKGTGIGLYMSKRIVLESMKGKLHVQNSKNGALFIVELPLKKQMSHND